MRFSANLDQIDSVARAVQETGVEVALFNLDAGDMATGEVDYSFVLSLLERSGYRGWVGLEHNPTTPAAEESFGWMKELGYA